MLGRLGISFSLTLALVGCGGGSSSGPTPLPSPSPTPPVGETVVGIVFFDENGNGVLDPLEGTRVPGVEVVIGTRSARSEEGTGRFRITGVPAGSQALMLRGETLPPFFTAGPQLTVEVPQASGTEVAIPLGLPIGPNLRTNVYMAFGDSITRGEGASAGHSYPEVLAPRLERHFATAIVTNRGEDATNSFEAVERIKRNLRGSDPAYTLILYGTNDWNVPDCQTSPPCQTVENLRFVVRATKEFRSLPFLSTLPPVNPALAPAGRNDWIEAVNPAIAGMAQEEGAFLVDSFAAFVQRGNAPSLFSDHIHPSDEGYALIAETFFEAIAFGRPTPAASAAAPPSFGFAPDAMTLPGTTLGPEPRPAGAALRRGRRAPHEAGP